MPLINDGVRALWFSLPNFFLLLPMPIGSIVLIATIWRDLHSGREYRPFFLSLGLFLSGYIGLGVSLWPYIVPYDITFRKAAAVAESQSLLLVGAAVMLPVVLVYTAYCYYVFRGKTSHETGY
jgi:cytochrome d ubiquinol oxidase subunit II